MIANKKLARHPKIYPMRSVARAVKSMPFLATPAIRTSLNRMPCMHGCGTMVLKKLSECASCRRKRVHAGKKRIWKIQRDVKPARIPRHRRRLAAGLIIGGS